MSDLEELIETVKSRTAEVKVVGIEGVQIDDVGELLSRLMELGEFQLLDGAMVLGRGHVDFAIFEAARSIESGENVSQSLAMEILVKASCTTQISEAIELMGVREDSERLVMVGVKVTEEQLQEAVALTGGRRSERPFEVDKEKRERVKGRLALSEPVEVSLLERIALSGVR